MNWSHAPKMMHLLMVLSLLLGGQTAWAQTVHWSSGYPSLDNDRVVTLESERTLRIRLAALGSDISNATIVVTLPAGINYVAGSATPISPGITLSENLVGSVLTLTVGGDGKLPLNQEKEFHLKVKAATCVSPAAVSFGVEVQSGGTAVPNGTKAVQANIVQPILTLTPQQAVVNFTSQTQTQTITYYLKATTVDKASSARISFTTPDATTTLTNFKVKGAAVTPTVTPAGGGGSTYTFDVTPAMLGTGNQIDQTNATVVTFTGASTGVGGHIVSTAVQFPSGATSCTSNPGSTVQLVFPVPTLPHMVHVSTNYATPYPADAAIAQKNINMDGTTVTALKTVFRNNGGPAKEAKFDLWCYGSYNYIDLASNVYVQIGSGPRKAVPLADMVQKELLSNAPYYQERYGTKKPVAVGKPKRIEVTIKETLPAGETITFWVPTVNGNIYQNTTNNVYNNYGTNTINGFTSNVLSVTAIDGKAGTMETMPSHRLVWLNVPHYREIPAPLNLRGGKTKTQSVFVAPGSTSDTPIELHVKAPAFLKITDMRMSRRADPTDMSAPITTTSSTVSNQERYLTVSGWGNIGEAYLHVTYEAATCGTPTNTTGKIHYWANHNFTGGTMAFVSQVFQDATHLCAVNGILLDTFHLVRTTVGRKDSNNNGVPDDASTPALANEIRNDVYISGDQGHFYWKGIVQNPGGFGVVDMPIELAEGMTFDYILQMQATGRGKVNGTAGGTVTFTKQTSRKGLVRYQPAAALAAGQVVEVEAPFTIPNGRAANKSVGVETEMFVRNTPASTRVGEDKASASMGTYAIDPLNWWYHDGRNHTFTDNSEVNFTGSPHLGYTDIFHNGSFPPPYFSKEARVVRYLDTLEFELPQGYRLIPNIEVMRDGTAPRVTVTPDASSTKTRRRYAVAAAAYDFNFHDGSGGSQPAGGKWAAPDDRWRILAYGKIQAYPSARRGPSIMKRTSVWRNPVTNAVERNTLDVTFTYSGPGNTLKVNPGTVTARGPEMATPTLQVVNQSSTAIPNLWFYFDGPIKDVKLKEGGTTYIGEGVDNRWVKVNPSITSSPAYQMLYTYAFDSTRTDCSKKDTVRVYTGFGVNANWPNTALPLDVDSANFSALDSFYITFDNTAHILGSITAKKDTFPAVDQHAHPGRDSSYVVYATFEASSTKGAVKNPEMDFTVPPHQRYLPGSAKLRHSGRVIPIPASSPLEAKLIAEFGSTSNATRSARLKLKEAYGADIIIPGGNETPDSHRKDSLEMVFMADCETDFTGIHYAGKVYGLTACGATADGNGASFTKRLIPDVTYNYRFGKVDIAMKGMPAFNEFRTRDTLVLTFEKIVGTVEAMSPLDHLLLRVPKQIDVDGDSIHYLGLTAPMASLDLRDSILSRDSIGPDGERYIKIPLPKAAYDGATDKGVHGRITCHVPVIYNRPTGADSIYRVNHPVDSIFASVTIQGLFGDCPPRKVHDGLNKDSLVMITARGPFPPRLYVGEVDTLTILSRDFHGTWYTDSTTAHAEFTGHRWPQSPRDTTRLGEEKYYFTPVVNGHYYGSPAGRLPFPVKIWIHPWFIRNLPRFQYICEEQDTLRVKGGGMDIRYQWFQDESPIAGATDTFLVVREEGRYYVEITDTVPETVSSDTCAVVFRQIPVITKDLEDIVDCDNIYRPLAVRHTGRYMLYQWYRNGLPIPGATDSVYRASAYDSSSFYRVKVMNPCGDSVMSRRCFVDFCDAKWEGPVRTVELFAPATVETLPGTGLNRIASRRDFHFTVRALRGQSLRYVTITADHPAWTEHGGGIERTMISDSLMTVRVRQVTHNLQIRISGVSPTANAVVDDATRRAWTHKGQLYLRVDRPQSVRLFTVAGALYREQSLPVGLTVTDRLPAGFYLVRFSDGHVEKVQVE